jgi:hypothetical protein
MPSFVNRQECMDMIDASEVCIPTLLTLHSCKIMKGTIPGPSSVLVKASTFSRNLIIHNNFKCICVVRGAGCSSREDQKPVSLKNCRNLISEQTTALETIIHDVS